MERGKQGRPLTQDDDLLAADRRRDFARLGVIAPFSAILAAQRHHEPEAQAPFRHPAGAPGSAKREGVRLVVGEREIGSRMAQRKSDAVALDPPGAQADGAGLCREPGEAVAAGRISGETEDDAQRQIAHRGWMLAIPAVPVTALGYVRSRHLHALSPGFEYR